MSQQLQAACIWQQWCTRVAAGLHSTPFQLLLDSLILSLQARKDAMVSSDRKIPTDIVDAAHAGTCYRSSRNSVHPVFDHHGAAYYIATRNKLIAWHGDMVRRMAHEPFQAILSWMPPRTLCARVHTHPRGHAHVCTHAHACAYTHVCRHAHTHTHTHTYAHTCKQLAFAEEKSETLMQLAISLTPSCRCSLSSWRCSLSSWSCFF